MPETTNNRIFISIGVSRPGGGLEPLPGAITAAKRMAAWAQAQGYTPLLLHDEALPEITIDLLRDEITQAINKITDQTALQRLVVFFAGHGAALAMGDQYWILTHWHKRTTEAIKVSSLQRMLEYYGPRQVSIIGDACQEFSSRFMDLVGSAVLDKPDEAQQPYELDQFFAVDVGKQAFMVKASGTQESFCVFTEVLLDALEGDGQESSFETIGKARHVTSQSLARYLVGNVEREAGKYGVSMSPRPRPGFYTDTVYLTLPKPPPKPPRPRKKAGTASSRSGLPLGGGISDLDAVLQTGTAPAAKGKAPLRSVSKAMLVKPGRASTALAGQAAAALQDARENSRKAFFDAVAGVAVRDHFETGCGICVSGADVVQVQAAFGQVSAVQGQPNWFRIHLHTGAASGPGWTDTLVTLADGRVVPVCAVDGFVAALHIIDAASLSLFHRPIGGAEHEGKEAIDLLARMHAGLPDLQTARDATALLRNGKHWIITLGCVAAQFHDAVRDVDSLRAMAAFYAMHHQPVPLDILLYGGGALFDADGRLYADIPAVAARQARTGQQSHPGFTCGPTPAFQRWPVAGRIPWMRQAWGAVETAQCDPSAADWRRQALSAMEFLAPGLFTIARPEGHEALARLAGIQTLQCEPSPYLSL